MTTEQTTKEPFASWAELQIMGHIRHVGYVSEVDLFGVTMVRVDTIDPYTGEQGPTKYYGASSIYSLEPRDEAAIRQQIEEQRDAVERRKQLMSPRPVAIDEEVAAFGYPGDEDEDEDEGQGEDSEPLSGF